MPAELAKRISQDPGQFSLEGDSRELSIMFCDVHNFSAISEQLEPKELAELLNTLFTPLTRILYKHHGIIDKYMGDAIMAFWGAPLPDPHHATNAVAAAFEMQEAVKEMMPGFVERGWPSINVGIGVNTGVVSVGNMGSEYRVAYTVIGDAVNLASRLQELTRIYSARIIVGEATRRACTIVTYRELGLVQVKGKNELARIYEPSSPDMDPHSTLVTKLHRHNEALHHYYDRNWQAGRGDFQETEGRAARRPPLRLLSEAHRRVPSTTRRLRNGRGKSVSRSNRPIQKRKSVTLSPMCRNFDTLTGPFPPLQAAQARMSRLHGSRAFASWCRRGRARSSRRLSSSSFIHEKALLVLGGDPAAGEQIAGHDGSGFQLAHFLENDHRHVPGPIGHLRTLWRALTRPWRTPGPGADPRSGAWRRWLRAPATASAVRDLRRTCDRRNPE